MTLHCGFGDPVHSVHRHESRFFVWTFEEVQGRNMPFVRYDLKLGWVEMEENVAGAPTDRTRLSRLLMGCGQL